MAKIVGCPKDYSISNIVDDLSNFFNQLREVRNEILRKREMEEQLRKQKAASEAMQQQLRQARRAQDGQDLISNYTTMKSQQFSMQRQAPGTTNAPTLGTLRNRREVDSKHSTLRATTLGVGGAAARIQVMRAANSGRLSGRLSGKLAGRPNSGRLSTDSMAQRSDSVTSDIMPLPGTSEANLSEVLTPPQAPVLAPPRRSIIHRLQRKH